MAARKDIGNVDAALEELGSMGRYTVIQFSMQILAQFAVAHHMLSIVFTGQKNPYRCPTISIGNGSSMEQLVSLPPGQSSATNSSLAVYDSVCHSTPPGGHLNVNFTACNAYNVEYELPKDRFFASEFDLVCDREFLAGLTQTLLTLGHALGAVVFPYFADNFGRKPLVMVCSFLWIGSSLALAFSVNYVMFAVFKTLMGVFLQGVSQTSSTMMVEVLTSKQRGYMVACLGYMFWTLGTMLMVPVAYLLRDHSWRALELAYCSYFIFVLLYTLFLDESLRWLAANGLKERVMFVLKKASRWNGANFDSVVAEFYKKNEMETKDEIIMKASELKQDIELLSVTKAIEKSDQNGVDDVTIQNGHLLDHDDEIDEKLNFLSLFKNRHLRLYTFFYVTAWFFNGLTYYGLILMSSSLSGSVYLNYFLNCAVELPSAILIFFIFDKWGRKICFAQFSFIAGVSLVTMAILSAISDEYGTAITVLAIVGKFGISGSFASVFTYTPELLPTTIRNTGTGLAHLSACLGGMLSPFADLLMSKVVYAPGLIFGSGSLILSVWTYFLPETANRQLPQSLREIENWTSKKKKNDDESPVST